MAITDKLSAIGNAIRAKTGKSDLMTLDEMPQEISSISTGGGGGETSEELDDVVLSVYVKGATSSSSYTGALIESYQTDSDQAIRAYAFYGCKRLASISCPNITEINQNGFTDCSALTEVEFPNVTKIGTQTFQDCEGLVKADFGSVTYFSSAIFRRANNLETLIIRTTSQVASAASTTVVVNTKIASGTGYIYVPAALLEQYKVATNWVTYADQFRAIEDYPDICGTGE